MGIPEGYLTLPELCKKYDQKYFRIYQWIKRGWLKATKAKIPIKGKSKKGGLYDNTTIAYIIKEEDWLEIPAFLRNKKRKSPFSRGGLEKA